ncbi:hypothetical protein M5D96_013864, partial [Drosophila gunungcola]
GSVGKGGGVPLFLHRIVRGSGQCLALSLHCSGEMGGAFLIPNMILLLLIERPVYYLEVIIGQFSSSSCIKAFDMVAIMKGIAYGQVYSTATTYCACIMALTIRYLVASFSEVLSWTYCLVEWGSSCVATGDSNDTSIGRALTSTRGRAFNRGSEPTSRDTSRIPTILRPRSIPTSRIPIRRLAGDPKRNTSPIRDTPLEAVTSASACSLPLLLGSENTPFSRKEKSHHRVIELNKVRGLEMQHKKLENLQSEFMHKIRTLAPPKASRSLQVCGRGGEREVQSPTESVQDLKVRCRAVVDSCFMLFYDHLQLIQKSKDEHEARNQREKIRNKLESLVNLKMNTIVEEIDQLCGPASKGGTRNKSLYREIARLRLEKKHIESKFFNIKKEHCDQMNQLRSDYEANLADELAASDHTITRIGLRMHHRLEEAHVGPDKARHFIDKQLAQIAFLVGELKEARELIVNLQQRQDFMDKGVKKKDLVNNELASKEEESRKLFGILKFKQREVRRQEHVIQLLKEQIARGSMALKEQEVRIVTMQEEIKRLKQTLSKRVTRRETLPQFGILLGGSNQCQCVFLALASSSENTVGDHERKPEVDKDSVKRTKCLPRQGLSQRLFQPFSRKEKSHHRVIELNKVRGLEMQHKKLENLQGVHAQNPHLGTPKLQGVYKFVAVVVTRSAKSWFTLTICTDCQESAKKHIESKFFNIKKEHCDQMNQLRSDYEANLADELAASDHTISELKKSLRRSEDGSRSLRIELGKLRSLAQIAFLVGELKEARELIVNLQQRQDFMDKGVKKKDLVIADLKLQMRNLEDHKNFLIMHADFAELNEKYRNAMMQIRSIKYQIHRIGDPISSRGSVKQRDDQIAGEDRSRSSDAHRSEPVDKQPAEDRAKLDKFTVNNELASKEEESRKLFGILKFKQREVRRQEHVIQLLKEQIARGSMALKEQEVRIVTMQEEIKRLKQTLSKPSSRNEKSHHRVNELNKVRGLEMQHKKLENLQSKFMHKIRILAPQKLQGVYKSVAVVVNEKCKVVVHADDLHRLPKNLPTESVHDLKVRCRAVVDSYFMLFYDHLQLIQKSKDEHEARNQREKIRNKLKEHCDQMNQLISEYEANLADELAACDHTISELKKSLRRSEDVVEELSQLVPEKSATLANEDGIIGELRIEMGKFSKLRMHHRLEEAHVGPDKARHFIDKQLAQIAFLVGELKEARELIVNLQQRQDFMDKGEQRAGLEGGGVAQTIGILSFKQREVSRQEHVIQLLKEQIARGSMALKEQEVRIVTMQEEIKRLKQTLKIKY